jgi:hypothetical protein
MKRTLLALIAIIFLFAACTKDENATKLDTSRKAWQAYKANINNSYSYSVYFGSWTGSFRDTKITVQNGKVTERMFIAGDREPNSTQQHITITWTETGTQIGTHDDYAAKPLTLDQVYAKAPSMLNVSSKDNDKYFEVDSNGLISSCGYVPKGCQDDCFRGIQIKDIKPL